MYMDYTSQIYNVEESSVKVQNQRIHEEDNEDESFSELFATATTAPHPTIKVGWKFEFVI